MQICFLIQQSFAKQEKEMSRELTAPSSPEYTDQNISDNLAT